MARTPIRQLDSYRNPYSIYYLYMNKQIIFIGVADNPKQRIKEILRSKRWANRITHFEIELLPNYDKYSAHALRNELVVAERPWYNEQVGPRPWHIKKLRMS